MRRAVLLASVALLCAPAAASAGVATADGGGARYADPDGAADDLVLDLQFEAETPSVDPLGWSVQLLTAASPLTATGCEPGFVGVLCPFGATAPAALDVALGGGDDRLRLGVEPEAAAAPTRIAIAGGPGGDRIETVAARANIDGGEGNDVIAPDERYALDFPPGATPGGVVRGGAGTDGADYTNALDPIDVSLDGVANDGRSGEGDNVHRDVEDIAGSGFGGTLVGSAAANRITGGGAGDRIAGGAGRDTLDGGGGDDVLDALDGAGGDRVACDVGTDAALVDAGDRLVPGCERLTWAPALGSATLRVRRGRVAAALACPKAAVRCRGTLLLHARAATAPTLASAGYRIAPGKRVTVRLAPTRAGRRALRRRTVRANAIVRPAGTTVATGRTVRLRR